MSMSDELEGKVSLVTGGSGDIGSAIAKRLGQSGSTVVITYVGAEDLASQTVDEIKAEGGNASALRLDQRDPNEIEAIITQISQDQGRLDILVNNAAWNIGIPFPNLEELTAEIWDRVLETNLRAPFLLARALAKRKGARRLVSSTRSQISAVNSSRFGKGIPIFQAALLTRMSSRP